LSKLERGHKHDISDVRDFVRGRYTDADKLRATFIEIEPNLVRYPAIDPVDFKVNVDNFIDGLTSERH
jgi:hypothetical protein